MRLIATCLLTVSCLALAGCEGSVRTGTASLDVAQVERKAAAEILKETEQATGEKPKGKITVDCPGEKVKPVKGKRLDCILTAADGARLSATVTFNNTGGDFGTQVGSPIMS